MFDHTLRPSAHLVYATSPQMKLLLITLYNKPSNKFADFIADLDRLLCKLPTDALITILSGDFNVMSRKETNKVTPCLNLIPTLFMPLHHVKSNYNLILYYTSTYVERVGVSQHNNVCSFINYLKF